MEIIKRYKDQHEIIISLCDQLVSLGTLDEVEKDAALVLKIFNTLDSILDLHLKSEDDYLYPRLLAHENPKIKSTAAKLQTELLETTNAYEAYKHKYPDEDSLKADPDTYVADTKIIIDKLKKRIQEEETQLYTLFN